MSMDADVRKKQAEKQGDTGMHDNVIIKTDRKTGKHGQVLCTYYMCRYIDIGRYVEVVKLTNIGRYGEVIVQTGRQAGS